MAAETTKTRQYKGALDYARANPAAIPNAVSAFDKERLRTYTLYEDYYLNLPTAFEIIKRADEGMQQCVYVPSAEKIIEAICRFHAKDPAVELSTQDDRAEVLLTDLWDREGMSGKYVDSKRWGGIRGDAAWYITADTNKKEGQRISITDLDPSTYFPIEHKSGKLIGCYIVDEVPHPDENAHPNEKAARRQTYIRAHTTNPDGTVKFTAGPVAYRSDIYETGRWDDRTLAPTDVKHLKVLVPLTSMPKEIDRLPVYWMPNPGGFPGAKFGRSDLAGIETLVASINQTVSDADLTLAIKGLGAFVTNAPPPRDAAGNEVPFEYGPGQVISMPGKEYTFENIAGVASMGPYIEHVDKVDQLAQQSKGVPDVAVGKVDVTVAESGISLRFQLGPILAKGSEKETARATVEAQMLYDILHKWFPAYEGYTPSEALRAKIIYGNPVPRNTAEEFEFHVRVYELGIYPAEKLYAALNAMPYGFDLQPGDFDKALEETTAKGKAADPFGAALAAEPGFGDEPVDDGSGEVEITT